MTDALILLAVVVLVTFIIAPFLLTMCCLGICQMINMVPKRKNVSSCQGVGQVNLAMEDDSTGIQYHNNNPHGLLGTLRSSLGNNGLNIALDDVLVDHDELSRAYEGNMQGQIYHAMDVESSGEDRPYFRNKRLSIAIEQVLVHHNDLSKKHEGDIQGQINLAMEDDSPDFSSLGALGEAQSSQRSIKLSVALERILSQHYDISKSCENVLLGERTTNNSDALFSSLGSKNLKNALDGQLVKDQTDLLTSTWPQLKRV